MEEVKEKAVGTTFEATYYTHQAIIIGCCMGDYSKPLLDVRRVKNVLKTNFNYECRQLENPSDSDIRIAISESLQQMNWTSRDSRLLIYFSGSATTSENNSKVTCLLNQSEQLNIAEVIQDIERTERTKAEYYLDQQIQSGQISEEKAKILKSVPQLSNFVHIVYDVNVVVYDKDIQQFKEVETLNNSKYCNDRMWKCIAHTQNSSPKQLVMMNRNMEMRDERIEVKQEMGSYNTELFMAYMEKQGELPINTTSNGKKGAGTQQAQRLPFIDQLIDFNQSSEVWRNELQYIQTDFFPQLKRKGCCFTEKKIRALTPSEEAEQQLKKLESANQRAIEEKKISDPDYEGEDDWHMQPYISSIEDSASLSEKCTDSMRLKRIEISGKKFFVSVATDVVSLLRIYSYDLKQLYEAKFPSDVYVVDFDLMYDGCILILIIEDCNTSVRELSIIDYISNQYIAPPSFYQQNSKFFSVRCIFNQFILLGSSMGVSVFHFDPSQQSFSQMPNLKSFYYHVKWIQIETYTDFVYLFFREEYRGYNYSGRHFLEKYKVSCSHQINSSLAAPKTSYDHQCPKQGVFKFLKMDSKDFSQGKATTDDMYFHLTCQGYPVIRQQKKVEILDNYQMKPLVSINCDEAFGTGKGRVFEKSELLKSQIDMLVKPNQQLQFAASKISKHRLFQMQMGFSGRVNRTRRMIDLQVSATLFCEYNFIDPDDHNITFAMMSSNRAGYLLVKIRNDDVEGEPNDFLEQVSSDQQLQQLTQ